MLKTAVLCAGVGAVAALPNSAPAWSQEEPMKHSDITWSFADLEQGQMPKAYSTAERARRRTQTGPPPVHLGYNPALVWNERMYFLLNNYHIGMPHSYNIPDVYYRSEAYLTRGTHPEPLDGREAIEDRVCSAYGLNLYDAGTWTIGLGLLNEFEVSNVYQNQILYSSTTGRMDDVGGIKDIRGDTDDFHYGKGQITGSSLSMVTMPGNMSNPNEKGGKNHKIQGAFFYRMIAACYRCTDPLIGAYADSFRYNSTEMHGKGPSWNTEGAIIWNDWKPITGEQAWGMMVGPLNFLYLKSNGTIPRFKTFAEAPGEVQLGISVLPAMVAMQSAPGSLYHCPKGSDMWPKDNDEATNVSNENNFSGYAGIRMLEFVLANNTDGADSVLTKAKSDVDKLIQNLEKWFNSANGLFSPKAFGPEAISTKIVYQGGHVKFSGEYDPVPIEQYSGFAVDCQTWGMSVMVPYLGLDWLDKNLGAKGAYNLWQQVKYRAGHFVNGTNPDDREKMGCDDVTKKDCGTIAGVGFTQDLNLTCVNLTKPTDNITCTMHRVWSGEWSFGAMTACKVLADEYEKAGQADLATDLRKDAASMRLAVMSPRKRVGLEEVGGLNNKDYDGGVLYANRRFFIPWGWYANAVSSLCSTSWSLMEERNL